MKVRDVIDSIVGYGRQYRGTTGDLRNYKKPGERYVITIPEKPNDEISPGLLASIRRKTGLLLR